MICMAVAVPIGSIVYMLKMFCLETLGRVEELSYHGLSMGCHQTTAQSHPRFIMM